MAFVDDEIDGGSELFGLAVASKDGAGNHGNEEPSEGFCGLSSQASFGKIDDDFLAGVETFGKVDG